MIFWILVAALIAVAFFWIAPVLLREKPLSDLDRKQQNISIARERLDEIAAEHASGAMTKETYEQSKTELEASLIDDVNQQAPEDISTRAVNSSKYGKASLLVLAVLIPLSTLALYQYLGAPEYLDFSGGGAGQLEELEQISGEASSIDELIERLRQRLEKNPQDGEGWFLLARTYMAESNYVEALRALLKTHEIFGDHPAILLGIADASAMINSGDLTGKPSDYIDRALEMEPDNTTGLWLGGMAAQQNGKFQLAVDRWTTLLPTLASEPTSQQQVRSLILQAQTEAKAAGIEVRVNEPMMPAGKSISVQVSLDPALADKLKPSDTVFIFARAASGPPMPLAAFKTSVSELPIDIILDDSMAMMPQMKLSAFDEVIVSARVSMSGEPIARAGDYSSDNIRVDLQNNAEVVLSIAHQVQDDSSLPVIEQPAAKPEVMTETPQADEPGQQATAVKAWVSIDKAIAARAGPNDVVFVFAKAVSGPPMPLAAFKTTVAQLPMEVTLDDSMAMMPQMKLSSFEEVSVSARISKSGQPRSMPGDLSSPSETVQLGGIVGVELNISEVVE